MVEAFVLQRAARAWCHPASESFVHSRAGLVGFSAQYSHQLGCEWLFESGIEPKRRLEGICLDG